MLSPDHPQAPKYWMHEISGVLKQPIERYLHSHPLQPGDVELIRAYLTQWIDSPVWLMDPNQDSASHKAIVKLRRDVRQIQTALDIRHWLFDALEWEIDPL